MGHGVPCVDNQVHQNLLELAVIGAYHPDLPVERCVQLDVLSNQTAHLYAELHQESRHGSPRVEANFLRTLAWVLPRSCHPIVVTDAGFRTPWFDAVRRQGWDYVGRLFPRTMVKGIADDTWFLASQLFTCARRRAQDLARRM